MESQRFFSAIDETVRQALPKEWQRVKQEKLPGRGGIRVRHAFFSSGRCLRKGFINILPLVDEFDGYPPKKYIEGFLSIRRYLLEAGSFLVVPAPDCDSDYQTFIDNYAYNISHDQYLYLPVSRVSGNQIRCSLPLGENIDHNESLTTIIRDLWLGKLVCDGPTTGPKTVGIELIKE